MSIEIKETDHETLSVNGKEIFKDGDGKWISRTELSTNEQNALNNYIKAQNQKEPIGE